MAQMTDGLILEYEVNHKIMEVTVNNRDLVKCKNCEHCELKMKREVIGMVFEGCYCQIFNRVVDKDFFCANGKQVT